MKWYVGTSGWGYEEWQGTFYPEETTGTERLSFYAKHFDAVEINTSFYHLPTSQAMRNWGKAVPRGFTFTVKGSRYITHMKRLKEPRQPLKRFMKPVEALGKKAPLIFQLPPSFKKDLKRLESFLKILPKRRVAIEFRNKSWFEEDTYALLKKYKVAFCMFEKGQLRSPRVMTADFAYVRLHGRIEGYKGNYSKAALKDWHRWLKKQGRDAYVFFDNTAWKLYALENAKAFKELTET